MIQSQTMLSNLLQIQNISFSYPGGKPVIHGVSFDIQKGKLVVIRGESGAGKSTFLKLFNRFNELEDGKILFHGRELGDYEIDEIRRSIIYLPQLPHVIEGTVKDNLSFPFLFKVHKNKTFDKHKAEEWLDYFQLRVSLSHGALKLSIGQRQRIALIRAILLEPEILLLDEPCASLDIENRRLIERKIESLLESAGITVLMATHSEVGFHESSCRFFRLANGELTEST